MPFKVKTNFPNATTVKELRSDRYEPIKVKVAKERGTRKRVFNAAKKQAAHA